MITWLTSCIVHVCCNTTCNWWTSHGIWEVLDKKGCTLLHTCPYIFVIDTIIVVLLVVNGHLTRFHTSFAVAHDENPIWLSRQRQGSRMLRAILIHVTGCRAWNAISSSRTFEQRKPEIPPASMSSQHVKLSYWKDPIKRIKGLWSPLVMSHIFQVLHFWLHT